MKIIFVSVQNGIDNIGARKIASYTRANHPETELYFLIPGTSRGPISCLLSTDGETLSESVIEGAANSLSSADVVGFSSMSAHAMSVKNVIRALRKKTAKTPYIVWGGIHPIVDPDDAIQDADAVCTGEGEFPFEILLNKLQNKQDFHDTPGFWFNTPNGVVKNANMPLITSEQMTTFPFPFFQDGENIYKDGKGFVEIDLMDIYNNNGMIYRTTWSIGCPFKCSYCVNTVFLNNDKEYRKLRHPTPRYIIDEIKRAVDRVPFTNVIFQDDGFLGINLEDLREFCRLYKQEIDLPFGLNGVFPGFVREEKMKILVEAGMKRFSMGIQSGSPRILKFYKRPTSINSLMYSSLSSGISI